jgi:hypothetical protein
LTLILNGTDNSATTPAVTGTDTDTGVYYPAANQVALATNGTQAMLANASQGVQFANAIGVGATTPTTSGAGITFPATQSASSDANTLDDYEEGTWTPTFVNFNEVGAVTKSGHYLKIGRIVYLTATFSAATSFSCGTGGASYIQNIPFVSTPGAQGQSGVTAGDGAASTAFPVNLFGYDNMYPPNISFGGSRSVTFSTTYIAAN